MTFAPSFIHNDYLNTTGQFDTVVYPTNYDVFSYPKTTFLNSGSFGDYNAVQDQGDRDHLSALTTLSDGFGSYSIGSPQVDVDMGFFDGGGGDDWYSTDDSEMASDGEMDIDVDDIDFFEIGRECESFRDVIYHDIDHFNLPILVNQISRCSHVPVLFYYPKKRRKKKEYVC